MKKSAILLTALCFLSTLSLAQPTAGSLVIGGNSGFNFYKNPTSVSNNYNMSFDLQPQVGKFLSESILLDGGLGYGWDHWRSNTGTILTRSNTHSITGNVSITKLFSITDKFYLTLGGFLNAGFGPNKTITEIGAITTTSNTYTVTSGLGGSPGFAYFINEKWMIISTVGALSYGMTYFESSGEMAHSIGYSFATNPFSLGFRYVL